MFLIQMWPGTTDASPPPRHSPPHYHLLLSYIIQNAGHNAQVIRKWKKTPLRWRMLRMCKYASPKNSWQDIYSRRKITDGRKSFLKGQNGTTQNYFLTPETRQSRLWWTKQKSIQNYNGGQYTSFRNRVKQLLYTVWRQSTQRRDYWALYQVYPLEGHRRGHFYQHVGLKVLKKNN